MEIALKVFAMVIAYILCYNGLFDGYNMVFDSYTIGEKKSGCLLLFTHVIFAFIIVRYMVVVPIF